MAYLEALYYALAALLCFLASQDAKRWLDEYEARAEEKLRQVGIKLED